MTFGAGGLTDKAAYGANPPLTQAEIYPRAKFFYDGGNGGLMEPIRTLKNDDDPQASDQWIGLREPTRHRAHATTFAVTNTIRPSTAVTAAIAAMNVVWIDACPPVTTAISVAETAAATTPYSQ